MADITIHPEEAAHGVTPSRGESKKPAAKSQHASQWEIFHLLCLILSYVAATGAILCAIVDSISVVSSFPKGESISLFMFFLRLYGVVFALLSLLAELQVKFVLQGVELMKFWVCRGMLQIFIAVLTGAVRAQWSSSVVENIFGHFSVWLLLVCGFAYTLAGFLGFGDVEKILESGEHAAAHKDRQALEAKLSTVKH